MTVVDQLHRLEREAGGEGTLRLPGRRALHVSSLDKVFFPEGGFTKGDLMRYYAAMAKVVLPVMRDRPLVLKRFPDGVGGFSFFQQNAPDDVPAGVRVETIESEEGEAQRRLVGGDLATLLYVTQLGNISVDPWHSRVAALDHADYTILDLDPMPRAGFARVMDVARWVREELDALGLRGAVKTSGKTGLHIYVPLPPGTTNEAALAVAERVATRVAGAHPKEATVERAVKARKATAVYVDYLQNLRAKTVAGAYGVRATPGATVSTPLDWDELTDALDPREFTIATVPDRVAAVGDLWGKAMRRKNRLPPAEGEEG